MNPSVGMLDLSKHYPGAIIIDIYPKSTDVQGAKAFCALLDELQTELKENPNNKGFYHNRSSLVRAYGVQRLYGLRVKWNEDMRKHTSDNDSIFIVDGHYNLRMQPCFIVLEKEFGGKPSNCGFLWTATRARNKGLAKEMMDFFDVRSAFLSRMPPRWGPNIHKR